VLSLCVLSARRCKGGVASLCSCLSMSASSKATFMSYNQRTTRIATNNKAVKLKLAFRSSVNVSLRTLVGKKGTSCAVECRLKAVRWLPLWGHGMEEVRMRTIIRGLRCGDVMARGDDAVVGISRDCGFVGATQAVVMESGEGFFRGDGLTFTISRFAATDFRSSSIHVYNLRLRGRCT
jgi:hypothetical protein